jgi:hypothetical protein
MADWKVDPEKGCPWEDASTWFLVHTDQPEIINKNPSNLGRTRKAGTSTCTGCRATWLSNSDNIAQDQPDFDQPELDQPEFHQPEFGQP